jgi:putative endonuclease
MMEESQGSERQTYSSSTNPLDELQADWIVYLAVCADGTFYAGITTDITRREREHNFTNRGSKYTRSRRPVKLFEIERLKDRSAASRLENKIKKMDKKQKSFLISNVQISKTANLLA